MELTIDTCSDMDESCRRYAEIQKKPSRCVQSCVILDEIKPSRCDQNPISGCLGKGKLTTKPPPKLSWRDRNAP